MTKSKACFSIIKGMENQSKGKNTMKKIYTEKKETQKEMPHDTMTAILRKHLQQRGTSIMIPPLYTIIAHPP